MNILKRIFRRRDPWAPIPTLTDLNGPRLSKRVAGALQRERNAEARGPRHRRLQAFLQLEGVNRR